MVQKELEIEYKSIISKEKYEELLGFIPRFAKEKESYTQINYFFDSAEQILDKQGITLRIRSKKGTWQLTAKIKQKNKGVAYTSNQEINQMISEEKAIEYLENGLDVNEPVLQEMLALANITAPVSFTLLGALTTHRTDFELYEDVISLDRNQYNDQLDYEIEWESSNHTLVSFMNQHFLNLEFDNGNGKRKRFLKTLQV